MIAVISDTVQIAAVTGLTTAIPAIILGWFTYRKAKETKAKVEETAKTVEVIHTLTNSAMSLQKKSLAEVTAAKAVITKDPADKKAAEDAFRDYVAHEAQQAKLNGKKP